MGKNDRDPNGDGDKRSVEHLFRRDDAYSRTCECKMNSSREYEWAERKTERNRKVGIDDEKMSDRLAFEQPFGRDDSASKD